MNSDPIAKHRPAKILPVHARLTEVVEIHWHGPAGIVVETRQSPHLDTSEPHFSRRPQPVEPR